jgi:hypothetical protein
MTLTVDIVSICRAESDAIDTLLAPICMMLFLKGVGLPMLLIQDWSVCLYVLTSQIGSKVCRPDQ